MGRGTVATIYEVAREAGVAPSTVSRVLSGDVRITSATGARVRAVVERLGYRPSGAARSLRRACSLTLGVIVRDLGNPIYAQYLRGAQHGALAQGYSVLICDGQDSADVEAQQLARLFEHRVDGLLLGGHLRAAAALAPFLAAGIPIWPEALARVQRGETTADTAELAAGLSACRHLIQLGHRRIAFVGRGRSHVAESATLASARLAVLHQALTEAGVPPDPDLTVGLEDGEPCVEAVRRLVAVARPPTAYIAGTYNVVARLLGALHGGGLRIPHDVSVLAYGDSEWLPAHDPPIAAIHRDYYAEGQMLVRRLIARIEGLPDPAPEYDARVTFEPRGSIAPVPRQPSEEANQRCQR